MTPPSPWIGSSRMAHVCGDVAVLQRLDVVERHVDEAARQRAKRLAVARRAGRRDRRQRAAVERVGRRDDVGGAVLALAAPLARQLDRRLVSLGAAVAEVDAVEARSCLPAPAPA